MPWAVAEYSALAGKTRAMYGKLLTIENYMELMRQKTVGDVAAYLKLNTYYSDALSGINTAEIHRAQLENILRKSLLKDYRKLFCFSQGNIREFLKVAYLKYEIESFKRLFRILETEGDTTIVEDSLLFLNKYGTLDIAKLSTAVNSQEFIANLEGTVYYDVLRPFLAENRKYNLFDIEMALDMYYLNLVFRKRKKLLEGLNDRVVGISLGTEVDVSNLLWIYRGRMIYNLDRSVILGYLIPHRYKLSTGLIYELVDAKDSEAFIKIAGRTKYANLFVSDVHRYYELNLSEYMHRLHRSFLRKYSFSISCALSYLHLKEYELSNIISIVEGIRYQLPVETIRGFITGIRGDFK